MDFFKLNFSNVYIRGQNENRWQLCTDDLMQKYTDQKVSVKGVSWDYAKNNPVVTGKNYIIYIPSISEWPGGDMKTVKVDGILRFSPAPKHGQSAGDHYFIENPQWEVIR